MNSKPTSFHEYVIRGIIANNEFHITAVKNLESLKSIFFLREEYAIIEEIIKSKNIKSIKEFSEDQNETDEYLEIMVFTDQNENKYCVTVYDSKALEQDPQVIEIYKL